LLLVGSPLPEKAMSRITCASGGTCSAMKRPWSSSSETLQFALQQRQSISGAAPRTRPGTWQ
jgi:hypothetical protein